MKVISAGLLGHLAQDTTTLATCVKVTRRDGLVLGYTTHDQPLTFDCDGLGTVTYEPQGGYKRSAIESQLGLSADNLELEGLIDTDAITDTDILNGLYDNAELKFMLVNWSDTSQGVLKLRRGYVGQITLHRDTYLAEIRGLMDAYSTIIGELYTPDCRADLGDARCKVVLTGSPWEPNRAYAVGAVVVATSGAEPLRQFVCTLAGTSGGTEPGWAHIVGGATADGGCTWTTRLAYTVACTVRSVTAPGAGEAGMYRFQVMPDLVEFGSETAELLPWFMAGKVTWLTGANAGASGEVKAWNNMTNTVELFLATPYPITVGDTFTLTVGCDKRRITCITRFANIGNMRAEPWLAGLDAALAYPSAHSV